MIDEEAPSNSLRVVVPPAARNLDALAAAVLASAPVSLVSFFGSASQLDESATAVADYRKSQAVGHQA